MGNISLREINPAYEFLNFDSHKCFLLLLHLVPICDNGDVDDDGTEVDAIDPHPLALAPTDQGWSCLERSTCLFLIIIPENSPLEREGTDQCDKL